MIECIDFPATFATIAAIESRSIGSAAGWRLAIDSFGERAGDFFELSEIAAAEKIGMSEPPALEASLQKLNRVLLF